MDTDTQTLGADLFGTQAVDQAVYEARETYGLDAETAGTLVGHVIEGIGDEHTPVIDVVDTVADDAQQCGLDLDACAFVEHIAEVFGYNGKIN